MKFIKITGNGLEIWALNSNGTSSSYVYDNLNRLTQLINKDKNLKEISRFTYAYDNLSRRISMNLINGSVSYSYDKSGRLIKESGALDSAPFSTTYAYDKAGNRLTSLEDGNPANNAYNDLNQLNQSYGADEKLIQVKGTVQDSSPVTVKVNDVSASLSGNQFVANNIRLVSGQNTIKAVATDSSGNVGVSQIPVTYSTSNALTNYGYDANGNLTSKSTGSNSAVYYYDYENRLKQYSYPGQSASYVYNGRGERVSKTVNGVTTKYYYDGSELALEKVNGGSILYVHGPMIDEIVSDSRGYSYHYDGLGSVVNLTDSTGLSVASYAYKAFGQIRSQSGSVVNSWGFTGRQYDSESGLHFYRNRYYDSMIGRFITRDPIGTDGGINLYVYCGNNPVNFTDPLGLDTYYINNKFDSSEPTDFSISHSFIACTDRDPVTGKERVTDTYSWTSKNGGSWRHNYPQDIAGAQTAINKGIGADKWGYESFDKYVAAEYLREQDDRGWYLLAMNNCKEKAAMLMEKAIEEYKKHNQLK